MAEAEVIKMDDFAERWRITKKNESKIVEVRFDEDRIVKGVVLLSDVERRELFRLSELDLLAIVKALEAGEYKLEREKKEPKKGHDLLWLETNLPPDHEFHDDQISNEEVKVKEFPYMEVFADFRVFNGLTLREIDIFLDCIARIFTELKDMHARGSGE